MNDDCKSIEDFAVRLRSEMPVAYLEEIARLSEADIKSYCETVSVPVVSMITGWISNKSNLIDRCDLYSFDDITGFVLYELWKDLRNDPRPE